MAKTGINPLIIYFFNLEYYLNVDKEQFYVKIYKIKIFSPFLKDFFSPICMVYCGPPTPSPPHIPPLLWGIHTPPNAPPGGQGTTTH